MQIILVNVKSATPIYIQILDSIRGRVRDGALPAGTPLPSVRQLAADLGVNPNTVAKAYMILEGEGVLHTVPRRGVFVADTAKAKAIARVDSRLDEVIAKMVHEASSLGIDQSSLLSMLQKRLKRANRSEGRNERAVP